MARLTNKELQARFAAKLRTTEAHRSLHQQRRQAERSVKNSRKGLAIVTRTGDESGITYWQGSLDFWLKQVDRVNADLAREDARALASL